MQGLSVIITFNIQYSFLYTLINVESFDAGKKYDEERKEVGGYGAGPETRIQITHKICHDGEVNRQVEYMMMMMMMVMMMSGDDDDNDDDEW